jgi:iron complex outermembrane receptor protein
MKTTASLVFQRLSKKVILLGKVYWRRNQDEYVFIRKNPSIYRNLHISNKIAAELNGSYTSNIGVTGFGIETAKVFLSSNRDNNRFLSTVFRASYGIFQ